MFLTAQGLAANPSSRRLVWAILQQAWPMLEQQYQGSMLLGKVAGTAVEAYVSFLCPVPCESS